jgi:hypothetical protein
MNQRKRWQARSQGSATALRGSKCGTCDTSQKEHTFPFQKKTMGPDCVPCRVPSEPILADQLTETTAQDIDFIGVTEGSRT